MTEPTKETLEARDLLMSQDLKDLIVGLRQNFDNSGIPTFKEAADQLEGLFDRNVTLGQEIGDLRNVIQSACLGGIPGMKKSWAKYFPAHPLSVSYDPNKCFVCDKG